MKANDLITEHVRYKEVTRSSVAKKRNIKNIPHKTQLSNIYALCLNVFEPLRIHFQNPIYISSCFRHQKLNEVIGGAKSSQHMAYREAAAMDLDAEVYGGLTNADIYHYIKDNMAFDQLIWEFGNDSEPDWVHVSYSKRNNRKEILQSKVVNNQVVYV